MSVDPISNRFSLFDNPFKDNLTLTQRVTIIAFHALTFGFPLAVYTAIDCCLPGNSILNFFLPFESKTLESALDKLKKSRNIAPYSELEQEALDFAKNKLTEHADLKDKPQAGLAKPVNQNIIKLETIYSDIYWKKFEAKLSEFQNNDPWKREEVLKAFEDCLKMAYAISAMTLEDLPAFAATTKDPLAKALTRQSGYLSNTIYYCAVMYHRGRSGCEWLNTRYGKGVQYPSRPIPEAHAELFYKSGTRQNACRELYNAYCDRIRMYVPENELKQERPDGDVRVVQATQKDIEGSPYTNGSL